MKQSLLLANVLLLLLSTCIISCEKGGEDELLPEPDATYLTSGILCTIGQGRNYTVDTLVVLPTNGYEGLREYAPGFTAKQDELYITKGSDGTFSLQLKTPMVYRDSTYTHIGIYGTHLPLGSGSFYPSQFKTRPSADTKLILTRNAVDGKMFSLESKAAPGYYLSAIHPGYQYQPNSTVETKLAFSRKKQEFFFMVR